MVEHVFGGSWTDIKLDLLAKYLAAYRQIFTKNLKASYFTTWYVDAFAGTGSRTPTESRSHDLGMFAEAYEDADTSLYKDGSARIALDLPNPFHKYLFIEQSANRAGELQECIRKDFPKLLERCELKNDDANAILRQWCKERNWRKERAVVFLDPYGMQVEWGTIEALAATKAIDLWYLFPLGGSARMLTHTGNIDEAWKKRLDTFFGTADWRTRFYQTRVHDGLFGAFEEVVRDATVVNIQGFIEDRLRTQFSGVANSRVLRNSRSSPMFALCFAASNEKGAPLALKIAQKILGKSEG